MTKVRKAGSCDQALWDFVAEIGRKTLGDSVREEVARAEGIAQVASILGVGEHVVRIMLDPDRPEKISLERAGILQRAFGLDLLARWLAGEAGGIFVPLPSPTSDMDRLTARGVRAAGEAAARVIEAQGENSEDGSNFSRDELIKLKADCELVASTFGEMVNLSNQGIRNSNSKKR